MALARHAIPMMRPKSRVIVARQPVNVERSFLVGDKPEDMAAAKAAGIAGHLFRGGGLLRYVEVGDQRPR